MTLYQLSLKKITLCTHTHTHTHTHTYTHSHTHTHTHIHTLTHTHTASSIAGMTGQGIFSQSSRQQQQQSEQSALAQIQKEEMTFNAVKSPGVFQDDRDRVLTMLNMVQASAGTGTGLVNYGGQTQTVNFSTDNLLCRFKVCTSVSVVLLSQSCWANPSTGCVHVVLYVVQCMLLRVYARPSLHCVLQSASVLHAMHLNTERDSGSYPCVPLR